MRVVIVGGGIAGLKAAVDLHAKGIEVTLLEARDRLGGRLLTDRTGLCGYDLGASWAHDTLSNELFDEMVASGKYDLYYDDGEPYYVGEELTHADVARWKLPQVAHELSKFLELRQFSSLDVEDLSLHDVVQLYLRKQGNLLSEKQKEYVPQFIRQLELWHGIGWQEMSSKFALVDNVGRNCLIRNGYDKLVDFMADRIPSSCVHLNTVVSKVDRTRSIKVTTADNKSYEADYLICTVPQSILQLEPPQTGAIEWTPALPRTITDPLSKMGYGKLGKIILEFETPFWAHLETDRFVSISSPNVGDSLNVWSYPVLILNMYHINKVPSLLCFVQGPVTEYLEAHTEKVWDYFKPLMKKFTDFPPTPTNIITTQWTADPFARGSYAACRPGDDPTDVVISLENGLGNVRFAGEHTILDGAGAVHGAWMSGKREANYLLDYV
ncbi:hypothetical protein OGAPHI_000259 [Ogataea philodendri]|uniref:Amine oxidase n=1 Tax=Ogataea philodendri TaxID=1378263 RepID=A0A9P8TAY1_9ASCO|nr:uncharacterized protein OGAPHI_000259 [Ogataea philodendri]KAH3671556.1 hypothetical protein OGAPHI_000259 [Ogataea philodendri]